MADNWMMAFAETMASQDDPAGAAKDSLFDPIRFAQTAAEAEFLETINKYKELAKFRVVVTLKRLFTFSAVIVTNDDDHVQFVVHPHDDATLQLLMANRAAAKWVEVSLLKPGTGELMMKLLFTNVRVVESERFMRYKVYRAEIDNWHTLVQNITELCCGGGRGSLPGSLDGDERRRRLGGGRPKPLELRESVRGESCAREVERPRGAHPGSVARHRRLERPALTRRTMPFRQRAVRRKSLDRRGVGQRAWVLVDDGT